MPQPNRLAVQRPAILRAWRSSGNGEFWIQLHSRQESLERFERAVDKANQFPADTDGPLNLAGAPSPTVGGFAVMLGVADEEPLTVWLNQFAAALEAEGLTGRLTPAPTAKLPLWLTPSAGPVLTGFAQWAFDLDAMTRDAERQAHWHIGPEDTHDILRALDAWATLPDADVLLRQGTHTITVHGVDVLPPITQALTPGFAMAGFTYLQPGDERARLVSLMAGGDGVLQIIDPIHSWEQVLDTLRDGLLATASRTLVSAIRPASRYGLSVTDLDTVLPLPGIREYHVRYNRHLLDRYVPDAHGVQILRGAHVERIKNPSSWTVTDLADDRYLVEAPNLADWYAGEQPDPAILAQARADFADILLTEAIIAAEPPPWVGGT